MTMNAELADFYNTSSASNEDLEKQASVENFAKLAATHGIDLSAMDDSEVNALYGEVYPEFAKEASAEMDPNQVESAEGHFQEKRAFQEKFAEADFMGRVMAHSFTQELDNIEKQAVSLTEAGMKARHYAKAGYEGAKSLGGKAWEGAKSGGRKLKDVATGKEMREGLRGRKAVSSKAGKAMMEDMAGGYKPTGTGGARDVVKEMGEGYKREATRKALKGAAKTTALYGGGAAAVGTGAHAGKKKKASADFEEISANHAIKIAEAGGWDEDEALDLVNAVYTLGLGETEKVAHVEDFDTAIHIRGLEYLETAGYPVDWSEIYG